MILGRFPVDFSDWLSPVAKSAGSNASVIRLVAQPLTVVAASELKSVAGLKPFRRIAPKPDAQTPEAGPAEASSSTSSIDSTPAPVCVLWPYEYLVSSLLTLFSYYWYSHNWTAVWTLYLPHFSCSASLEYLDSFFMILCRFCISLLRS